MYKRADSCYDTLRIGDIILIRPLSTYTMISKVSFGATMLYVAPIGLGYGFRVKSIKGDRVAG